MRTTHSFSCFRVPRNADSAQFAWKFHITLDELYGQHFVVGYAEFALRFLAALAELCEQHTALVVSEFHATLTLPSLP